MTVRPYIIADKSFVSRVRMIFQACGAKLKTEHNAAIAPMIVIVSVVGILLV
jgi:hypothetical protein